MKTADIKYKFGHYYQTIGSVLGDASQKVGLGVGKYKKLESTMPLGTLFIQVTNICNANCVFCAYRKLESEKGFMRFETFKKAVDEYVEMGGKTVSFTPIIGDPLIDSNLLEKIKYVKSKGKIEKIYFYSNGILLSKNDIYKALVDSGIHHICISLGDTNREKYKIVYKVDAYPLVIDGLSKLLKYNKEKGERVLISINFRASSLPSEIMESEDFKNLIKPYISDKVNFDFMKNYDNWGGVIRQEDMVGIMKMRRNKAVKTIPCARTFEPTILHNGDVRACSTRIRTTEFDELVVGNIHKNTLKEIYFGKEMAKVRESFLKNTLLSICKDCSRYVPATEKELAIIG